MGELRGLEWRKNGQVEKRGASQGFESSENGRDEAKNDRGRELKRAHNLWVEQIGELRKLQLRKLES